MRKRIVLIMLGFLACISLGAREDRYEVQGSKGKLAVLVRIPDGSIGKTCPTVILFHGFNDSKDASMFVTIASGLEAEGVASVRFDFNGHGESDGRLQDMTIQNELADADSIYRFVQNLTSTGEISFVGHSQGGVIATMMAGSHAEDGIRSIVLLAPASNLPEMAKNGNFFGHEFDPVNVPETLAFNKGTALMGREYILKAREVPVYEVSFKYHGPALIMQGLNDRIVPVDCAKRLYEGYWNCEVYYLDGIDHSFLPDQPENLKPVVDFLTK